MVAQNLLQIKSELPAHVQLVVVSKTKSNVQILEAYATGHRDFGENYVQELVDKAALLPKDIRWHFIGHLQSNKVKYIAPFVHLIHGVDSFKLLKEINKQAAKLNKIIPCLLQIHIAEEETKFGFNETELMSMLNCEEFKALENIRIIGLMGMATFSNVEEKIVNEFKIVQILFQNLQLNSEMKDFNTLSIGMSSDYKIAIRYSSTLVRIGSAIFGSR